MVRRLDRRKGMSLLEVILALATFLISVTGLVFLMGVASDAALEAQMRSQALSICQSRLAEASCGAMPLSNKDKTPCDDDNDYQWSMDVAAGNFESLSEVTVTVSRKRANGTQFECSMSQMILDPTVVGTVFDGAKDLQAPSTASGTTDPAATTTPSTTPAAATPTPTATPVTSPKTTTPVASPKSAATPSTGSKKGS